MIAATREPGCHCEDEEWMTRLYPRVRGFLREGMYVSDLPRLGSGCTDGRWVCPRLDKLRRRYGR